MRPKVGRREIDGDALGRKCEAAVLDRGAHAVTRLLDLGFRQAYEREGGQAVGQMHLDGDFRRGETGEGAAAEDGEGHYRLFAGFALG